MKKSFVPGPTYSELLHGNPVAASDLYRIGWHGPFLELPKSLTGVQARIIVAMGYTFPSGSHKVGATYSIVMEAERRGLIDPNRTTLIGPSTGNFGIGTAWTAFQKGYQAVVVMPDGMSPERTARIRQYGSEIVFTPGTESDVILTIEKAKEMGRRPDHYVLAQFEDFANYRFHYYVTGGSILERVKGRIAAFVSAPGSAGTIAAADRLKEAHPGCLSVAAEPVQCSTLFNDGVGQHRIEGIGDKMAPLILNICSLDRVVLVDDQSCVELLRLMAKAGNYRYEFGISGICNILASVKTAKRERLGPEDIVVTVATDGLDRYTSYIEDGTSRDGEAADRRATIFRAQDDSGILDTTGTREKERLHALKERTWRSWYEKSYLDAMRGEGLWKRERALVEEYL